MYNYGSPRVGNMVFVKQFNQLVPVQSHLELQDCPAHGLLRMCAMHVIVATQRRHTCSLRQDAWRVYNARTPAWPVQISYIVIWLLWRATSWQDVACPPSLEHLRVDLFFSQLYAMLGTALPICIQGQPETTLP